MTRSTFGKVYDRLLNKDDDDDSAQVQVVERDFPLKSEDLTLLLKLPAYKKYLKIEGELRIHFNIKLTGELLKAADKNDLFEPDVRRNSELLLQEDLGILKATFHRVARDCVVQLHENKQTGKGEMTGEDVMKAFQLFCKGEGDRLSVKLQEGTLNYVRSNKQIRKQYRKYQVNCVTQKIVVPVVVISGGIAATAASWGALAPAGIIAAVREGVGLVVNIYQMWMDALEVIKAIESDFDIVGKLFDMAEEDADGLLTGAELKKAKKRKKWKIIGNTAKEIGTGALSGIFNVPVPSVAQIGEKLELLENKKKGVWTGRQSVGEGMAKVRKEIEAYEAKVGSAGVEDAKKEKYKKKIDKIKELYEKMNKTAEEKMSAIVEINTVKPEFEERHKRYKELEKSWSRGSKQVFAFATSLTLGIVGGAGSGLELALAISQEVLLKMEEMMVEGLD